MSEPRIFLPGSTIGVVGAALLTTAYRAGFEVMELTPHPDVASKVAEGEPLLPGHRVQPAHRWLP